MLLFTTLDQWANSASASASASDVRAFGGAIFRNRSQFFRSLTIIHQIKSTKTTNRNDTIMVPGGHTAIKAITPELQEKVQSIKSLAEAELGETFSRFEATEYRSQVVAGSVYHFKITVSDDDDDVVHVKVFEPLPHTGNPMEIMKIKKAKKDDELVTM
jgi:cystatin-A/B